PRASPGPMIRWRAHIRNAAEAVLCVRIAIAIPTIWLATRVLPLPRTLRMLTRRRTTTAQRRTTNDRPGRCQGAVVGRSSLGGRRRPISPDRVLFLVDLLLDRRVLGIRPTCLVRSLVRYQFLREGGTCARLHLGVMRDGPVLTGHAWLTIAGSAFLEPTD